jgi:hypothetical protein
MVCGIAAQVPTTVFGAMTLDNIFRLILRSLPTLLIRDMMLLLNCRLLAWPAPACFAKVRSDAPLMRRAYIPGKPPPLTYLFNEVFACNWS